MFFGSVHLRILILVAQNRCSEFLIFLINPLTRVVHFFFYDRYKDSAAIMQLLRDNLALWQNDLPGVRLAC